MILQFPYTHTEQRFTSGKRDVEEIGAAVSFILTCNQLKTGEAEAFISATDLRQCTKCLRAGHKQQNRTLTQKR